MSPEETALARLTMALPGYRPRPGMTYYDPDGTAWVVYAIMDGLPIGVRLGDLRVRPATSALPSGSIPWITDDGTAGILLGILQRTERLTALTPHVAYSGAWYVELDTDPTGDPSIAADSLGVAVARALIAIGRCA